MHGTGIKVITVYCVNMHLHFSYSEGFNSGRNCLLLCWRVLLNETCNKIFVCTENARVREAKKTTFTILAVHE